MKPKPHEGAETSRTGAEKARKGLEKSIFDGIEMGLERYIATVFENTVLDDTTERLAEGIAQAAKAYEEAISLVEEALAEDDGEDLAEDEEA